MPSSAVSVFSDPFEHQQFMRGGDIAVTVTKGGKFRSELTRIDLHGLWMQRVNEALPRIQHTALLTRSGVFFLGDQNQQPIHHSGMQLTPDHLIFYSPGSDHYSHTSSQCHWAAMTVTPEQLAASGHALTGRDLTTPTQNRLFQPPERPISRLRSLHGAAGKLAATVPDILARPEVAKALEEELVRAMVQCLIEDTGTGSDRVRSPRRAIMRRFERVLEENRGKPLYVTEVCSRIGVSERTLRSHCLEHLGVSPHRYLWLRRMHQARRGLAVAEQARTTVTDVATECGFWELGRFSVAYRNLFGEKPSATLQREG